MAVGGYGFGQEGQGVQGQIIDQNYSLCRFNGLFDDHSTVEELFDAPCEHVSDNGQVDLDVYPLRHAVMKMHARFQNIVVTSPKNITFTWYNRDVNEVVAEYTHTIPSGNYSVYEVAAWTWNWPAPYNTYDGGGTNRPADYMLLLTNNSTAFFGWATWPFYFAITRHPRTASVRIKNVGDEQGVFRVKVMPSDYSHPGNHEDDGWDQEHIRTLDPDQARFLSHDFIPVQSGVIQVNILLELQVGNDWLFQEADQKQYWVDGIIIEECVYPYCPP